MPYALGAKVHLLDRAAPFDTYPYEREALVGYGDRGKTSADLSGLLIGLIERSAAFFAFAKGRGSAIMTITCANPETYEAVTAVIFVTSFPRIRRSTRGDLLRGPDPVTA